MNGATRRGAALIALLALGLAAGRAAGQEDRAQGRSLVTSRFGIVAAEHPLAAQAGAAVLAAGGSAADAAVAANAVMGVVAPMMNGIGGDLVAMVYDPRTDRLYGLDAIGWAPAALSPAAVRVHDAGRIPARSIDAVTVPGAVAGWDALLRRFGREPLPTLLAPAIGLAETGYPVSEVVAGTWAGAESLDAVRRNPEGARTFLPGGGPPRAGELFADPDLARSLRLIATGGSAAFYRGEIARRILDASAALGGTLQPADLADYAAEWVEPISTTYRGWTVSAMPPSTMGSATLEMLNLMEQVPLGTYGRGSVGTLHATIEAKALAYADARAYLGDPRVARVPVTGLLAADYARARAAGIDPARATCAPAAGRPAEPSGDTTYLAVVDRDGLMVSLMQSNFWAFGTGIVPPGTGFVLQNRGRLFSLDPASPNVLAGHKRPLHTLLPAFMRRGTLRVAFGVMGGDNQAQAEAQVVSNVADFGLNLQAALEAPRFTQPSPGGCDVEVEGRIDPAVRARLAALGHNVRVRGDYAPEAMGGGQAVARDTASGVNTGASDPRKDGEAIPEPSWSMPNP